MRIVDVYASVEEVELVVMVTAAQGSGGAALPSTVVSSRVQLQNTNRTGDIEYKVGASDWSTLARDQAVALSIDLSTVTVMLRRGSPGTDPLRLYVLIDATEALVGFSSTVVPTITAAPAFVGTPQPGQSVSYTAATAVGVPTPTVEHEIVVAGRSRGANYIPTALDTGKQIVVRAFASNLAGRSAPSTSAPLTIGGGDGAAVAPAFSVAPQLAGTPQVGAAVGYVSGTAVGTPTPTLSGQFLLDGVPIAGATGATYTPVSGDTGRSLSYRQTATNSAGSVVSTSAAATVTSTAVVAPAITTAPSIIGTPQVGVASSYNAGTYSGSTATRTRQWTIDATPIAGATGATYTPVSGDAGRALRVVETATNSAGSSAPNTSAAATVAAAPSGDTRPRFWHSTAQTYNPTSDAATDFGAATLFGSSESRAGTFTPAATDSQYVWVALPRTGTSDGAATFAEPGGVGGFQGASTAGDYETLPPNVNTTTVVFAHSSGSYDLFRSNYRGATTSVTIS